MDKSDTNQPPLDRNEPHFVTRESILQLFDAVDAALTDQPVVAGQSAIEVYVVGYSAIVLAGKNNRGSNDIDIIPSRFSRVFAEQGIEVFDEHYFYFPQGYQSRAVEVERRYRHLIVKYVDAHDIWFTKLAAFRSKDIVDMKQWLKDGVVEPHRLDAMFEDWNQYWFKGSEEIAANYAEVRHNDPANGNT